MVLSNNEELHEKIVKHLQKNGIGASCVLARNILFMCDEALNTAPQKTAHNNKYTAPPLASSKSTS